MPGSNRKKGPHVEHLQQLKLHKGPARRLVTRTDVEHAQLVVCGHTFSETWTFDGCQNSPPAGCVRGRFERCVRFINHVHGATRG
jgi:hypothetical protein